jgi:adenine phosphoribosyltransferase
VTIAQLLSSPERISAEGYEMTIGKAIEKFFSERKVDPQDWHREEEFGGIPREELLSEALFKGLYAEQIGSLKNKLRYYENFPKEGVLFADFLPILSDPEALQKCIALFATRYAKSNIDLVVGLESRGFILGSALAVKLGVGFVPVRKPGKLPGETISVTYKKEYGTDTLVIAREALRPGQRVLIVDDLIATGGSAKAAV